ncbi:MAG: fibrobacter succinogenes major paralogous domain-containing protein [Bacteroidales bacterium]
MKSFNYQYALILILLVFTACDTNEEKDPGPLPVLSTAEVKELNLTSMLTGGNITSEGDAPVSARGICWNYRSEPTILDSITMDGTGTGSFITTLTGLIPDLDYAVRAYATNSFGTAYGEEILFRTGAVMDPDGNIYHSVRIGKQTWMLENFRTTSYSDSFWIPEVADDLQWNSPDEPRFCWYENKESNKVPFGALYNWAAVSSGRFCPNGWHVPTSAEWNTLFTYLGGTKVVSNKLRQAGDANWMTPNTGATNSSGFTALPGSFRNTDGSFGNFGYYGYWWTSTPNGSTQAVAVKMITSRAEIFSEAVNVGAGLSVRLIKD